MNESEAVGDASAFLANLLGEPGASFMETYVGRAAVSAVNLAEILARLFHRGVPEAVAVAAVTALQFEIVPFTESQAWEAARLREPTRHLGLSLGDRACLALALERDLPVLTADRGWAELDLPIPIVSIR